MLSAYIHWNPDPEIFRIGGFAIRYYSLLFVSGLVVCLFILRRIYQKEQIPLEYLDKLAAYGFIGILLGARLGHCLFYEPSYYFSHPLEMILPVKFTDGGMEFTGYQGLASHGGALGLFVVLVLYARKTKHQLLDALDLIAIVAPLGSAFIRLANLMNSEIIGMPSTLPWAFIFERVDHLPRHPAQLYEALAYLVIFGIMMALYRYKRAALKNGAFFGLAIVLIFSARFFIEFVKERQVGFEEGMTLDMGQWLSIPYLFVGIGFLVYGRLKTQKEALISR